VIVLIALATNIAVAEPRASLALRGATIYPSPNEPALRDGVVLIDGAAITAVGARGAVALPPGARTIDCSGLTIVYRRHILV
jgi:imidazolonepropionase-like amidohydrolase